MPIRKTITDTICEAKGSYNRCPFPVPEDTLTGIWVWYSVEDRLLFSEGMAESIGIPKESYYTFSTFLEVVHGNDLLLFLETVEELLKGGPPGWTAFHIVKEDNEAVKLRCYMEAVSSEFGEVVDVVGICFKMDE